MHRKHAPSLTPTETSQESMAFLIQAGTGTAHPVQARISGRIREATDAASLPLIVPAAS